jgi:putative ABC transport system ATP-binding protein
MSLISLKNVMKMYRLGEVEVPALQGVSVDLSQKQFVSFVGPSGSGKSTLLNIIGCLDKPTGGEVVIDGVRINDLDKKNLSLFRGSNIGFIFQSFNLIQVLSVFENVEYPLITVKSMTAAERKELIGKVLDEVGIYEHRNKRPNQLSGGQMQRVAIARALVMQPKLILADEPTANLDHKTSEKIIKLMHEMKEKYGTLFVFATHDPRVMTEAEVIYELMDGMIVSEKNSEALNV